MADAKLAVLIATRGRPAILKSLIACLQAQSRRPDAVIVVATEAGDWAGIEPMPGLTLTTGPMGLAAQRNHGLGLAGDRFDTLVFFDDDFVPSRFWLERAEGLFAQQAELASLTGLVLSDGIMGPGIPLEAAQAEVEARDAEPRQGTLQLGVKPYGCNMAFRTRSIAGLRFDDRLPLYAWLEDKDFGTQAARRGQVAWSDELWGVHLGHKTGRVAGVRLGYSQIANPIYLVGKGTAPLGFSAKLMTKNVIANLLGSFRPEPMIDRAGRLRGNLIALGDVLRGRVTPERAARL